MSLKELTKKASYKKIQYPKKKESYMTLNDFIKILLGNQFNQFDFFEKANVDEFSKEITICLERRIGVPYTCIHCGQQCLCAGHGFESLSWLIP